MTMSPLSWLVLNATANDYEDIETIKVDVRGWCEEDGTPYSDAAVLGALFDLIKNGFVSAYRLSAREPPVGREVASQADITADTYFLVTALGKAAATEDPRT